MLATVEVIQSFDWSKVAESDRAFVQERKAEISGFLRQNVYGAIEIGLRLLDIKQRLGYGLYRDWIAAEFSWGKSAATRFEQVATRFGHLPEVAPIWGNLDLSAAYVLAEPSTPNEAVDQAIALAEAGEPVSYSRAKALKSGSDAPPLKAGQTLTVADAESPYAGQAVTVRSVDKRNGIARCSTDQGDAELLLNELLPPEPNPQPVAEMKPQPPSQLAILATELEVERERVRLLEAALRKVCAAARARQLNASILVEAEALIL